MNGTGDEGKLSDKRALRSHNMQQLSKKAWTSVQKRENLKAREERKKRETAGGES